MSRHSDSSSFADQNTPWKWSFTSGIQNINGIYIYRYTQSNQFMTWTGLCASPSSYHLWMSQWVSEWHFQICHSYRIYRALWACFLIPEGMFWIPEVNDHFHGVFWSAGLEKWISPPKSEKVGQIPPLSTLIPSTLHPFHSNRPPTVSNGFTGPPALDGQCVKSGVSSKSESHCFNHISTVSPAWSTNNANSDIFVMISPPRRQQCGIF